MNIETFGEKSLKDKRTPEEILESKKEQIEEELKKITDAYIENADDKSIERRENCQEELNVFLEDEKTTDDEKELVGASKLRNGLEHLNLSFIKRKVLNSEKTGDYSDYDSLLKNTEEFDAQLEIMKKLKSKISDLDRRIDIYYMTAKAYPEYYDTMYEWEKK